MPRVVLIGAQLQEANLSGALLQEANLSGAQLQGVDLSGVQLQGANLFRAQLQEANLSGAQLQGAYLGGAQLQGANLGGAQLQGANLSGAQLQGSTCGSTDEVEREEVDTDWTLCDKQKSQIENAECAKSIIDQLGKMLPTKTFSQIPKRIQIAIGKPIAVGAICGKLTPQMVDVINATRHSGGVPDKTLNEWAKAGSPCPIPGQKPPPVPKKPAAKSP